MWADRVKEYGVDNSITCATFEKDVAECVKMIGLYHRAVSPTVSCQTPNSNELFDWNDEVLTS